MFLLFYTRDCKPCYFLISAKLCLQQQTVFCLYSPVSAEFKMCKCLCNNSQHLCNIQDLWAKKLQCCYLSIAAHQQSLQTNVLFKLKSIRNKYQFCQRNSDWNGGPYVWGECREKTEQRRRRRRRGGGRKVWSGRSICTLPDRLFWYSKSRLTRILNMADLALHTAHKDHSYLHRFTHTHKQTYAQPSRLPPAPPA